MVKVLKRFFSFLFYYKKAFLLFILVSTFSAILENLNPYVYKLLIDAIPRLNYGELLRIVFLFVGLRIIVNFSEVLSRFLGDRVLIPASRDARMRVFRQIQDLDFAFHTNKSTGSLISAFKRGDGAFFSLYDDLSTIFRTAISLVVVLFFFNRLSSLVAGLMLMIFVVNALVSWRLIKINIQKRKAFNKVEDEVSGIITDNLINYETVKFFAQEKKEGRRLGKEFIGWSEKIWGYANSFRLMDITIGSLSNLGILLIFWLVIRQLIKGQITIGDLVMVVSFTSGFYWRFFDLLYRLRSIAKNYADIRRYFSFLDDKILVLDPAQPVKVKNIRGKIEFNQVDFHYPDNNKQAVLKKMNLKIRPGESVAFVGRSGAGKTTIVKLLLRFYDVASGQISLDNIDVRCFAKSQLRSFIGVVPQEPVLFNNTLGFNISYGNDQATPAEIKKAVQMANLEEFIESLPEKYETPVGERGIKLSGGQKQRLAIARMFLADPRIIIFDEATSNLDSESERLIQDALWKVAKGRTVLIIAHRFSIVRKVDRIVAMEKGQIKEVGSHQELLKKKGLYYYLWQLQTKGEKSARIKL